MKRFFVRGAGLRVLLLVAAVGLAACAVAPGELSETERALAAEVGMSESELLVVRSAGDGLRRLEGYGDEGTPYPAAGVSIGVAEDAALPTVKRLRDSLGSGYQVFVSERHYGIDGDLDVVSVLVAEEPFAMLRTMGTNGWNYDLGTDAIVARLELWDERYGLDIYGVGYDFVEARLESLPSDTAAFAEEVYAFCPDVVDQGLGSVEALRDDLETHRVVSLWWD